MPNKFNRNHLAVGDWKSPWRFLQALSAAERVRVLLQDKLIARGKWVYLYLPVSASTPGSVPCTCVKNTTDSGDMQCLSCFGSKFAPGYQRFLAETRFWCSAEATSFTLTNTEISTLKKSNVIVLSPGQTSGQVVTQDKPWDNAPGVDWEVKLEASRRATGETFILEYSTDSGTTWTPVTLAEVPTPGFGFTSSILGAALTGSGVIRWRLTMTRGAVNDIPPAFEIIRMRRVMVEHQNPLTLIKRPDRTDGTIMVLQPWLQETPALEAGRGRLFEHDGQRMWTSPLDFFDTSIAHDTPPCRVAESFGPHPFVEIATGVQARTRYLLTKTYISEKMGTVLFTHQYFDDRRAQDGEPSLLVW